MTSADLHVEVVGARTPPPIMPSPMMPARDGVDAAIADSGAI